MTSESRAGRDLRMASGDTRTGADPHFATCRFLTEHTNEGIALPARQGLQRRHRERPDVIAKGRQTPRQSASCPAHAPPARTCADCRTPRQCGCLLHKGSLVRGRMLLHRDCIARRPAEHAFYGLCHSRSAISSTTANQFPIFRLRDKSAVSNAAEFNSHWPKQRPHATY